MIEQEFSTEAPSLINFSQQQQNFYDNNPKALLNDHMVNQMGIYSNPPWSVSSWRSFSSLQQPTYENQNLLQEQLKVISQQPGIVQVEEIEKLIQDLVAVENGEQIFLQMGDCAEIFCELDQQSLMQKVEAITATSRIFANGFSKPCVKIGRIGGQYAKPRTQEYEILSDGTIQPNYRGDNVNTQKERNPDPTKLTEGHLYSTTTMKSISQIQTEVSTKKIDLVPTLTNAPYQSSPPLKSNNLRDSSDLDIISEAYQDEDSTIYSSHEGLLLSYEEAVTKQISGKYYNLSAHMLWIGERTRQLDGGHVEYFRGIQNPVGAKIGPSIDGNTLKSLVEKLNPKNEIGKLIIICRFGNKSVDKVLPQLIETKKKYLLNFIWSVDPMHGNTYSTERGIKTRNTSTIIEELTKFATIMNQHHEQIGGIHLETSPLLVTECIGLGVEESDLHLNYTSSCDPRLNLFQTLTVCQKFIEVMNSPIQNRN